MPSASVAARVPVETEKVSAAAVSVRVMLEGAVTIGVSLAPVKLTVSVLLPVALPSEAETVKDSEPEAERALREELELGWKRYLPVLDSM